MSQKLSSFEQKLMRAMGLDDVARLDELFTQPISQGAADHSEPPDEGYELQEKAEEYLELLRLAQERFEALSESTYIN
ncbi:MAG: hypothetical protein WB780_06540 [Candidatus Acidiferrales bacterium]